MGPRANLAATLLIAGVTLLVAIAIGNAMGSRVLGLATERGPAIGATPVATPLAEDSSGDTEGWKHEQIVSVATDPGFPDPRVTPEPPPPPPPPPRAATPLPRPSPSPTPTVSGSNPPYTSPPLPIPLVSHTFEPSAQPGGPETPAVSASP